MTIKNLSVLTLLLFLSANSYSQTQKGRFALSGKTDLNFLSSKTTIGTDSIETATIKNSQSGFTIGAGYFVADNFMIALSGAYSYVDTKIESGTISPVTNETITTTLAVIPQFTYYFPLAGKLRPSLTAGAGYLWMKERDSQVTGNRNIVYSYTGLSYTGAAGLSYFITRSVAFDISFQYSHNSLKDKEGPFEIQKQNIVAGAFGVSVFF